MRANNKLRVRVNDELELDAGTCEAAEEDGLKVTLIRPPAVTLFHQVLAYLRAKPDPPLLPRATVITREAVAAAAVTLRWGSYFCVLADATKPVWAEARSSATSRIDDPEMARINIEASAALAEWIDLKRATSLSGDQSFEYLHLVDRAVTYLPMPQRSVGRDASEFGALTFEALAYPPIAVETIKSASADRVEAARRAVSEHASRVFANAVVNIAWRNGPVESVHAGQMRGYPLDERRVTVAEERRILKQTCQRMASGLYVCSLLETPHSKWPEQVLPYALAQVHLITPSGWTLTESSREVRLSLQPRPLPAPSS